MPKSPKNQSTEKARADRFVFWSALILLAWLPLPWGSHTPWAQSLFTTVAAFLLGVRLVMAAMGVQTLEGRAKRLWWPLLLWLCWIGWIGMQIVPVSPEALALLSPQALKHLSAADVSGTTVPLTVSIGRGLTADSLLLTCGYFSLYWLMVLSCWRQPERVRWALGVLVLSGGVQALYGSVMTLSGWEYGFFEVKQHYRDFATGTFVNRNHLAGYLELTAAAGIGLILADLRVRQGKITWMQWLNDFIGLLFSTRFRTRIILAIIAVGIVMTRSRMGNAAFFSSLCFCGLAYIFLRERRLMLKAILLFGSLVLIDVLIVSNWFGLARVVDRIESTDLATESRVQIYDELPAVVNAYERAGSGLGTFWQAYAFYRTTDTQYVYDHAHNDYLEMLIEVGWPGVLILAALVGGHALHAFLVIIRRRSRLPAAAAFSALMALSAFALHSTVDFNLQIPANAATLIVLLALSASFSSTSRLSEQTVNALEMPERRQKQRQRIATVDDEPSGLYHSRPLDS